MTNYEKIKNMTIDEMARFLCEVDEGCDKCYGKEQPLFCSIAINSFKIWLESEAST